MVLTSASLILSGIACLCLSGYMLYAATPREGKPPTIWTATENRSTIFALMVVTLFVFGAGLLLKGFLS